MRAHTIWTHIGWIIVLGWVGVVLLLTLMPGDTPLMHLLMPIFSGEVGGAMGHAGLLGSLTLIGFLGLTNRLPGRRGLLLIMAVALLIGTGTELLQIDVVGRASTATDLLGNWLGVFVAGFVVSMFVLHRPAPERY